MKPIANRREHHFIDNLQELGKVLLEEEETQAAKEIQEIIEKLGKSEVILAFCGHFSAGKSSLINRLCGKQVLPSSPLPTSANVVMIRYGSPRVVLSSSDPSKPPVEVSVQAIEQHARNGQDYARVELWDEVELLDQGGVLLDTPGVDSNDAGHALATHSALHLADIVFYVMDYNHVSSETNLSFAKSLSDNGKPLYMVINQIDKHREEELPFEQYRSLVEQAFRVWNVKAWGTFYISLQQEALSGNMLPVLEQTVRRLLTGGSSGLLEYSAYASAAQSLQGYLKRQAAFEETERLALVEEAGGESDVARMEEEYNRLEAAGGSDEELWASRSRDWLKQIGSVLESAQLMIPSVRELASRFLESRSSGFKVKGWFGSGKTEAERLKRRDDFLHALREQVDAQVNWHVRQELRSIGQQLQIWNETWEQELDRSLPTVEEAWITEPLPGGALLSGEATLHYAAAVAAGVTARYRRAAASMLAAMLAAPSPLRASAVAAAEQRRAELAARLTAARRLAALDAAALAREARLGALLGAPVPLTSGVLPEVDVPAPCGSTGAAGAALRAAAQPARKAPAAPAGPRGAASGGAGAGPASAPQPRPEPPARGRALQAAACLEAAAQLLAPHPAFGTGVRELSRRAAELRRGVFTVALFGAFSAGKSSFANALLGEAVLPVSPHPTTASIIRIMSPGDGHRHFTANIKFKSAEAMREDLVYSLSALGLDNIDSREWKNTVLRLNPGEVPAAGRAHFSFLKAAAAGWEQVSSQLGSSLIVDYAEFERYAAEETKACFVAEIDFYYSSSLTEQGIVLVDTPGADSIHARHTGVTFQYMKNSDALLFVTYYNHAFSRADKQFLTQLGRIKGSFALDKMFFIINAADLAASEDELAAVMEHVRDGLRTAGIQQPNVHAISSRRALAEGNTDASGDPGFEGFSADFRDFLERGLGSLAVAGASAELKQVADRLSKWIDSAEDAAKHAGAKLESLQHERAAFEAAVFEFRAADIRRAWSQENEELLFHVVQRLRLHALDLFVEFFHPSLLQEGSGSLKRNFAIALRGWLDQISGELERELLATSLRLERKAEALLLKEAEIWCHKHEAQLDMPLVVPNFEGDWNAPAIPEGLLDGSLFPSEAYWPYFKNPKTFFEGEGRTLLRSKLEGPLLAHIKEVVQQMEGVFESHYETEIGRWKEKMAGHFSSLWQEWEDSIRHSGVSEQDLTYWKGVAMQIGSYIEEMEAFYDR